MKILSLDGGGTRGYITARILQRIEELTGKQCYQLFDMITGVSTGSIVACMLGQGYKASEIADFYLQEANIIFADKKSILLNLIKPKYDKDNLNKVLNDFMKKPFSEMRTKVMVYAIRLDKPDADVQFWKSWKDEHKDIITSDIVQSSCSAPTYFAPHTFGGKTYVDGGIFCNNPSMCAISECAKITKDISNIYCLNIELDRWSGFDKPKKIDSLLEWLFKIGELCIGSSQNAIAYQSRQIIGDRIQFIQAHRWTNMDSLDFGEMNIIIREMIEKNNIPDKIKYIT
jgi:patatin-like phospholipase/acyl hydrolase